MSMSMSSTNKIQEDRPAPTPTTRDTPDAHQDSHEITPQATPCQQRQAEQGEGLEAVRHLLGLQNDRIAAINHRLEIIDNTIDYIYLHTSTSAILQENQEVRLAALRADSARATNDNMIQRHTHSIRQIHQKITGDPERTSQTNQPNHRSGEQIGCVSLRHGGHERQDPTTFHPTT